eukprot:jgi/Chrpa1/5199/Chrysochromulina_OHIO_Genome00002614-RA
MSAVSSAVSSAVAPAPASPSSVVVESSCSAALVLAAGSASPMAGSASLMAGSASPMAGSASLMAGSAEAADSAAAAADLPSVGPVFAWCRIVRMAASVAGSPRARRKYASAASPRTSPALFRTIEGASTYL